MTMRKLQLTLAEKMFPVIVYVEGHVNGQSLDIVLNIDRIDGQSFFKAA